MKAPLPHPRPARRPWRALFTALGLSLAVLPPLATQVSAASPNDPAAELASLKIADGYEVNLFASELDGVVKPIQIRFDPQGRLWVVGSTVYPQLEPGQVANDKVLVLEDTDGDGRADKSTVFADGLMIPTGIELGHGGVYVGANTELLFFKDTNGDLKADEKQILLRGFGTGDAHQTINSFTWGPSGELMMCQGLHALSRVETPWGLEKLHSAAVWRFWPRLLRLDGFWNDSMGPQNPFGVTFDRWGQPIVLAGNGEGVYYLTPAMIRTDHRLPMKALWNTGRKFGGGDFVENSHFPPDAQGTLITGGYINNTVARFKITENGTGFTATDLPHLISSTNTSFRIVDARFGPDGALYLCDWYNPVIGHYQASFRHPDRDKTHGRIWRVTAKNRPLVARPALAGLSTPALLDVLKSSERWNRQTARRLLADRPAQEVTNALQQWTAAIPASDPGTEHALMEALGVWASHEAVSEPLLRKLLAASDPHARAYANRVVGHWATRLTDPLSWLRAGVRDENPRVRLEAVVAASYVPEHGAMELATEVLARPMDSFLEYALTQTIHATKPQWSDPLQRGELLFANDARRLEFLVRADGTPDTLDALRQRLGDKNLSADTRGALLRILADTGDAADLARLLSPESFRVADAYDAELQARVLPALAQAERLRKLRPAGDLVAALNPLLATGNPNLRGQALKLAGVWGLETYRARIEQTALDPNAPAGLRRAAIESLGTLGSDRSKSFLTDRIGFKQPDPVVAAVVSALAGLDLEAAAKLAAELLSRPLEKATADEVFTAFLQRKGGPSNLTGALRNAAISREAAAGGLSLMSSSGKRDDQLARLLTDKAGLRRQGTDLNPGDIAELAREARDSGNAARGADVYRRPELNCAACHAINGVGGTIGPDLGSLGTAQTPDFIVGAILYPNREVKEGFMSIEITTRDGEEFQGYFARETPAEVVLRDVLRHDQEIRIRRDRIQERKQHGSVMPTGLADTLSRKEFRDLIAFLSSLGKPGR